MDPSLHRAKRKAIQYVWYEQQRPGGGRGSEVVH